MNPMSDFPRKSGASIAAALAFTLALAACTPATLPPSATNETAAAEAVASPSLIPMPATMDLREGAFRIDASTAINAAGESAVQTAAHIAAYFKHTRGVKLRVEANAQPTSGIVLTLTNDANANPEAYPLDITPQRIAIGASSEAGLFRGAMSLWQLLPAQGNR